MTLPSSIIYEPDKKFKIINGHARRILAAEVSKRYDNKWALWVFIADQVADQMPDSLPDELRFEERWYILDIYDTQEEALKALHDV